MATIVSRIINGHRYNYFQEYDIDPATGKKKRKPTRRYMGRASHYGFDRFISGLLGFGIRWANGTAGPNPWTVNIEKAVQPVMRDKWALARDRMTDEVWGRYIDRLRSAYAVYPSSMAEYLARRDVPGYQEPKHAPVRDMLYEKWYAERVERHYAWQLDRTERREEIAARHAEALKGVQPPPGYQDPHASSIEGRAQNDYTALREENNSQVSAYWATVEAQNERDRLGNEQWAAERVAAKATSSPESPEEPEQSAEKPLSEDPEADEFSEPDQVSETSDFDDGETASESEL